MPYRFEQGETLAVLKKNSKNRVLISRQTIQNAGYLDIRIFFFDEDSDEWKRTRKGICLRRSVAERLHEALGLALNGQRFADPALQVSEEENACPEALERINADCERKDDE